MCDSKDLIDLEGVDVVVPSLTIEAKADKCEMASNCRNHLLVVWRGLLTYWCPIIIHRLSFYNNKYMGKKKNFLITPKKCDFEEKKITLPYLSQTGES